MIPIMLFYFILYVFLYLTTFGFGLGILCVDVLAYSLLSS